MQRVAAGVAVLTASASATDVSPIGKVVQMLSDLQAKVIKEGESAHASFAEFSEWCEDRARELSHEIKTGTADVENLKASISDSTVAAQAFSSKVDSLAGDTATNEADLEAARKVRDMESKTFKAEDAELVEEVDMVRRAKSILEREMAKGSASMLQMQDAKNVASVLSAMVEASMMSSADANKLTALIQSTQQVADPDFQNAPSAAVYENQSGNIVDTLQNLLDMASDKLDAGRKKEMENRHAFEMLAASLEDEIKFAKQSMEEAKKGLAEANEAKAAAEGDLQVASKELAADTEAKGQLHQDCMNRAEDFQAATKSRAEELKALVDAKKVLQEATGGASDIVYGAQAFIQTSLLTTSADLKGFEAVRMVRDLARRENSAALTQLSFRLASVRSSGASDPFEKIKGLISDMVQKLEEEAAADATKKAHCDHELSESNAKKAELTAEVDKLTTRINQRTARANKLRAQAAQLQQQLSKMAASQAEMDKMRASENEEYKRNKADMEQGLQGVKTALKVLNEYYAKEDKAHNAAEGAGASVIGLLEVCESDFSKNLAEIVSTEESAAADYERETKDNDVERAEKEKGVEYKTKQSAALAKEANAQSADLANVQAELDSVLEYLSSLEGDCSEKVESYAERKARREAELAGLKEALNTLETETAFVQVRHRRFLGVSKHIH